MSKGKLILFPTPLDESLSTEESLPAFIGNKLLKIKGLICESEKPARRFLRRFISHEEMQRIELVLLNEHHTVATVQPQLEKMMNGEVWGLISDAGLPCIADPGADLVWHATQKGIDVEAIYGPCSIITALQLSGFSGQSFTFHGYLPKEEKLLEDRIRFMESQAKQQTQIWIEAPYRTDKMIRLLKQVLDQNTRLCVACRLTSPDQKVISARIKDWPVIELNKQPAVFLIG